MDALFLAVLLVVITTALLHIYWNKTIIYFDDDWFPFNPTALSQELRYAWYSKNGGTQTGALPSLYISLWYYGLHSLFQLPLWFAQFFTVFLLMLIGAFFMYKTVQRIFVITGSQHGCFLPGLISSLFYMMNPYSMVVVFGNHLQSSFFAWTFYPLFTYSLLKFLDLRERYGIIYSMLAAFSLYLSTWGSLKIWITLTLYTLFFSVWATYIHKRLLGKVQKSRYLLFLGCFMVLFIPSVLTFLNAYSQATSIASKSNWDTLVAIFLLRNEGATILNVFRLWGMNILYEPWYVAGPRYLDIFVKLTPALSMNGILMFIPILFITIPLIVRIRKRGTYLFFYILLVWLLTQLSIVHGPFATLFLYLLNEVPVLYVYDDPWFASGLFFIFTICILLSLSIRAFLEEQLLSTSLIKLVKPKQSFHWNANKIIALVLLVFYLLPQSFLFISGSYVPHGTIYNAKMDIPDNVKQAVNYINLNPLAGKVLAFPTISGRVTYDWPHYFFGKSIFFWTMSKGVYANDFPNGNFIVPLISKLQSQSGISNSGLFSFNKNVKGFVIPQYMFYSSPDFRHSSYTFIADTSGYYKIKFVGEPVGHVGYVILNGTHILNYQYVYINSQEYSLVIYVAKGLLIEPVAWKDSNVSQITITSLSHGGILVNLGAAYCDMLKLLGVRWVITDNIIPNPLMYSIFPNRTFVESQLQSCHPLIKTFGSVKVFELNETLPQVFAATHTIFTNYSDPNNLFNSVVSLNNNIFDTVLVNESDKNIVNSVDGGTVKLSYIMLDPTRYIVKLNVTNSKGFILVLNENYDKGWVAYILDDGIQQPIPTLYHLRVNGFANGWYIRNAGNFTVILYYQPEQIRAFAMNFSNISIISIVLGMVILWINPRNRKRNETF
jgi:hypothetical protein